MTFTDMPYQELTCEVGLVCSLVLRDGSVFQGRSFGVQLPTDGEVGLIVCEKSGSWLFAYGVQSLCDVNTRALTCRLQNGVTLGRIVQGALPSGPLPPVSDPNTRNLVAEVSVKSLTVTTCWLQYEWAGSTGLVPHSHRIPA
ncbi:hypothetical protein MSG28_014550 [Choristoneura fumiferana]|uniref:Uncharacterized protein n=1 Tax=Choristoneura fumiferana TaxID=7141 RepID=A0ACC0JS17_CHOFU|nr:hypothetical protein MSG28_014550 [Choristoneura fumiferana]